VVPAHDGGPQGRNHPFHQKHKSRHADAAAKARILPDPEAVGASLYAHLDRSGNRPVRAIQRIRAVSLGETDAELLEVAPGVASLHIERTSYLASGRVVEFTRSIYRGDTYDFVAELRLGDPRGR